MSLRPVVLLLALASSSPLLAATEFENGFVPIDLVRQFASGTVYRSLPDGFPVVTLPAGTDVRLVGSMKRGSFMEALLTTTQSVDTLRAALVAAYTAAGWVNLSTSNGLTYLCRDDMGYLLIATADLGYHGLRLSSMPISFRPGLSCREQTEQAGNSWDAYFLGLMPVLSVPPQTLPPAMLTPVQRMSSSYDSSGGGIELDRDSHIEVPNINVAGLYAHFAARLVEQGWHNDSEDTGVTSASSVWYASVAPPEFAEEDVSDTQLTAVMTILHEGNERYRVLFKLRATTDADLGSSGSFIGVRVFVPLDSPLNDPALGIRGIPSGYAPR